MSKYKMSACVYKYCHVTTKNFGFLYFYRRSLSHFTLILFYFARDFFFSLVICIQEFPQDCEMCTNYSNITGIHNKIIETFKPKDTKQPTESKAYVLCYIPLKCIYVITENTLQTNSMGNKIMITLPCFYGAPRSTHTFLCLKVYTTYLQWN